MEQCLVAFNGLGGCGLFFYLGIFMVFMGYSNSQSSDILLRAAVGISQIFGGQDIPLSSQTMTYATATEAIRGKCQRRATLNGSTGRIICNPHGRNF